MLREAADQVTIRVYREPKQDPELEESYIPTSDDQALHGEGPDGQVKVCNILSYPVETRAYEKKQ